MKTIGFAHGKLYRCSYGAHTVVVAAPDRKTAVGAFEMFLHERGVHPQNTSVIRAKPAKTIGQAPLLWAQVDVTAV